MENVRRCRGSCRKYTAMRPASGLQSNPSPRHSHELNFIPPRPSTSGFGSLAHLAVAKPSRNLGILPCARARAFLIEIRTTYQRHLFQNLFFDRVGNFEATKVLIMLIPGVLGTATRPLPPNAYASPRFCLQVESYYSTTSLLETLYCCSKHLLP